MKLIQNIIKAIMVIAIITSFNLDAIGQKEVFKKVVNRNYHELSVPSKSTATWSFLGLITWEYQKSNKTISVAKKTIGTLPSGYDFTQDSENDKLKCQIKIIDAQTHVVIEITNWFGECIATIVDQKLTSGYHEFEWNRDKHTHGAYKVKVQVKGQTQTSNFAL